MKDGVPKAIAVLSGIFAFLIYLFNFNNIPLKKYKISSHEKSFVILLVTKDNRFIFSLSKPFSKYSVLSKGRFSKHSKI